MEPDFSQFLLNGEELMWQGERHPEGPPPNSQDPRSVRFFAIVWTLLCCLIFGLSGATMFTAKNTNTADVLSILAFGLIFIGVGVALFCSSFVKKKEYYALTDRRFLIYYPKNGRVESHDLKDVVGVRIVGQKDIYGTLCLDTGLTKRVRSNKHWRTVKVCWYMVGIEETQKVFALVTGLLDINRYEN